MTDTAAPVAASATKLGSAERRRSTVAPRWLTAALLAAYAVVFAARGLPSTPETVVAFVVIALVFDSLVTGGVRATTVVLRDWWPIMAILIFYSLTRGVADTLGMPVQRHSVVTVEKALTGGGVPTTWLQEHLLQPRTQWWEAVTALVYVSHFVVSFVALGVLYGRDRAAWRSFSNRFLTLNLAGMATYVVLPAAPPWMAGREGLIDPVARTVTRGLDLVGLQAAGSLIAEGRNTVNEVAAVPSLHAGYAFLVAMFLWRRTRRWRPVLAAYPVAMGFTLVYSGEHYVVDVLLGAVYAGATMLAWDRLEERRQRPRPFAPAYVDASCTTVAG